MPGLYALGKQSRVDVLRQWLRAQNGSECLVEGSSLGSVLYLYWVRHHNLDYRGPPLPRSCGVMAASGYRMCKAREYVGFGGFLVV